MLLALTLSGCATEAQRESNSMQQIINETKSSNDSCKQQMNQNPSVQIIFEKVVVQAMGDGYAINRFELLRKEEYLTPELQNHLVVFLTQQDKCSQIFLNGVSRYNLKVYQKYVDAFASEDVLYQQLIKKEINIGNFNSKRIELRRQTMQELSKIVENINTELQSRHNAESQDNAQRWQESYQRELDRQSRERAARNLNPQPYKTILPPVYNTNCYRIGNNLNCTTQ
jgi:hypothetical protein